MNQLHWVAVLVELGYIIAAALFIIGLKMMGKAETARRGNIYSAVGMLLAIVGTIFYLPHLPNVSAQHNFNYEWILIGLGAGTVIGVFLAVTVKMTGMPELVGLLNGLGGLASFLVGWQDYRYRVDVSGDLSLISLIPIVLAVLIGGITFSGSMIAWAKLKELMSGKPILYPGQNIFNGLLLAGTLAGSVYFCMYPAGEWGRMLMWFFLGSSLILGVLAVIPIGGANMPVVISLMNSYSGVAGCAAGFVMQNDLLIAAGALVGASGVILTVIMCKAMNRSLFYILFSGFGSPTSGGKAVEGKVNPINVEDAYYVLEAAKSLVFIPGYGMAVGQAQHAVRELGDLLESHGVEVRYAIHPVAGRMPGHMNVLLAEANVSYDKLVEMDDINAIIETIDVAIIIGANDVVNPAAREDKTSPIFGMPIINADKARSVFVIKRGMGAGFAGIPNPLFYKENTRMIFGDAKPTIQALVEKFKK